MSDKSRESAKIMLKKMGACWIGQIIGAVVGYCVSFFFQNALIRMKLGFGGYLSHFFDVINPFSDAPAQIWFTAWLFLILGAAGGAFGQMKLAEMGRLPKPGGWKKLEDQNGQGPSDAQPPTSQQEN